MRLVFGVSIAAEEAASSFLSRECVMLVLTRKQGEQIRIGADVVITVVRTKGKAVRLGIQAPAHVPVLRGEIAVAIAGDEEQKSAGDDEYDGAGWANADGRRRSHALTAAAGVV
jgi:carbon storage regulator CsrA